MRKGASTTAGAGIIVSVVIIAAIASIGYLQLKVAPTVDCPGGFSSTCILTTSSTAAATCTKTDCVNVTLPSGASTGPGYSPDTVTVVIGVNATVMWTNMDGVLHTVTADKNSYFDSGPLQTSGVFMFNFTSLGPGTYTYHCSYHPPMHGTVIVKPKSAS